MSYIKDINEQCGKLGKTQGICV